MFYKARPKVLELTGKKELKDKERSRFCYVLLPLFMLENPELTRNWRVLYKPRGELIEPHTRLRVGLGTAEVAYYRSCWTNGCALGDTDLVVPDWRAETHGPHHRFGGVVAVEKGGIADLLRQADLHNRRDVAIIGNEGQSVEAELVLADAFGHADVPLFLLCDFDRQGFTIAENLRAGTWRHRYRYRVKVIHVGLRLAQIEALGGLASRQRGGLEDEPIGEGTLKHVSDERLRECGATENEIRILRTRRVELNALTTEQLVALAMPRSTSTASRRRCPTLRTSKPHGALRRHAPRSPRRSRRRTGMLRGGRMHRRPTASPTGCAFSSTCIPRVPGTQPCASSPRSRRHDRSPAALCRLRHRASSGGDCS